MTHETLTNSQLLSFKAVALRMFHLPLSVYGSVAEVSLSLKRVERHLLGVLFAFLKPTFCFMVDCNLPLCPPTPLLPSQVEQSISYLEQIKGYCQGHLNQRHLQNFWSNMFCLLEEKRWNSSPPAGQPAGSLSTVSAGQTICWYLFEHLS